VSKKKHRGTKSQGEADEGAVALPKVPERLASPFRGALSELKQKLVAEEKARAEKKAPPAPPAPVRKAKRERFTEDDATALGIAMQGVKPLSHGERPSRVAVTAPLVPSRTRELSVFEDSAEARARARLDALVSEDVRFRIERDAGYLSGVRSDAPPRVIRDLARRTRVNETLDLHGMSQREASEAVVRFVRRCHRAGLDVLCIIHGKGAHSEDGVGVLRDVALSALTGPGAAPLVHAFVTAPEVLGGSGALVVELHR
jgi:DNA-nicking Smr family endonuclease